MSGQSSSRQQEVAAAVDDKKKEYDDDDMIVNFQDAVLYGRDLKLLEGSVGTSSTVSLWLNDGLVHFRHVRLTHLWCQRSAPFQNLTSSPTAPPRESAPFLCMDPSVLSFLMMLSAGGSTNENDDVIDDNEDLEEELRSIAASHNNFEGVQVVFLPVNDGLDATCTSARQSPKTAQGTHWSVLMAIRLGDAAAEHRTRENDEDGGVTSDETNDRHLAYLHFDSVPGHNHAAALALAARWNWLWCVAASRAHIGSTSSSPSGVERSRSEASEVSVRECRAPRQANGFDCGVHVLGSVEALLEATMEHDRSHFTYDQLPILINSWEETLLRHFGTDPARVCASLRQRMARDIRLLGRAPNMG